MSTPHIWLQRSLAAGDRLAELCDLPPGSYRLRTLEAGPQEDVTLEPGAALREIVLSGEGVGLGDAGEAGKVVLRNAAARPLTVIVEERSEEHTSELQSLMRISYAVFCLKKKTKEDN